MKKFLRSLVVVLLIAVGFAAGVAVDETMRESPLRRLEVQPPEGALNRFKPGATFEFDGNKWQYIGGPEKLRAAWRIKNAKQEWVMPLPSGEARKSAPLSAVWTDVLGVGWKYDGSMDEQGNPRVSPEPGVFGQQAPLNPDPEK